MCEGVRVCVCVFLLNLFCVFDIEKATEQQILHARTEQQQNNAFPSFLQEDDTTADSIVKDFYKVSGISTMFFRQFLCVLPQVLPCSF